MAVQGVNLALEEQEEGEEVEKEGLAVDLKQEEGL